MNIRHVKIKNYQSCEDVKIDLGSIHALVGMNNAGKSTILRALDFLFNPSTTKINKESFWNHDITRQIWIEAVFKDLTKQEIDDLSPYLRPDGTFHIARSAKVISGQERLEEEKIEIGQHYCCRIPKFDWLCEAKINGNNITEWWKDKENLSVNGTNFIDFVGGTKPNVNTWKTKAKEFAEQYLSAEHYLDSWIDNPQGYAGVLKGTLPHFIFVPAVRDLSDEAKPTKSNPFGRLLYAIIESVPDEQKINVDSFLRSMQNLLNRCGGVDRLEGIIKTENRLNKFLREYMSSCELEIEFQTPALETILTAPRLFADDGLRTAVENKGHGLQRAIIFSILQCYSELVTGQGEEKKRSMVFAVEEPELYMHPQAQRTIRRVFRNITKNKDQVIFSTHSALFLDVAEFDEILRVEALQTTVDDKKKVIRSRVWQLPIDNMIRDVKSRHPNVDPTLESIRELYANAYHPLRSEGFFAKKIILVEGPTEQYALPLYAEGVGLLLDNMNISIVDCGGKGSMDRLYRIFNELGIPCYMIFDYDKDSNDKDNKAKSKELLQMVGETNTEVPANILIKDRVACFPRKWESDLANEIPDIEQLTAEARKNLGLKDDSGKPLVARYIAKTLISKNPPEVPLSLQLIINKAVKIEWVKSCLGGNNLSDN